MWPFILAVLDHPELVCAPS